MLLGIGYPLNSISMRSARDGEIRSATFILEHNREVRIISKSGYHHIDKIETTGSYLHTVQVTPVT